MNHSYGWLIGLLLVTEGCYTDVGVGVLDEGIPRVETPAAQIATVRLKAYDGRPVQTAFLDRQGRVLEEYNFGLSSSRVRNRYDGPLKRYSIVHYHSDSSAPGYVDISESWFLYDKQGRLRTEEKTQHGYNEKRKWTIRYAYTAAGDTVRSTEPPPEPSKSTLAHIDRWKHNRKGQVVAHYALLVIQGHPSAIPDTLWHFDQRYTYGADGKRTLAWYDYMYLGRFYMPAGPDTIRYQYDQTGLLIGERHRYTTDMQNKREIDSTRLMTQDRWHLRHSRKRFFEGSGYGVPSNDRTRQVTYRYEPFDRSRHLPLHVPERT